MILQEEAPKIDATPRRKARKAAIEAQKLLEQEKEAIRSREAVVEEMSTPARRGRPKKSEQK